MSDALDFILINNVRITRPPEFRPQTEDVYKGDYVTCTGKLIADRIGWKYSDMTLTWDALPQSMVSILNNMSGICTMRFDDLSGELVTEQIIRTSAVALRHRQTVNGVTYWKGVTMSIRFINTHGG